MKTLAAVLALVVVMIPLTGQTAGESVQRGDHGPLVAEVQTILSGFGYTVVVDSRFGPQTEKAVRSWQRSNGLRVDGIVGRLTLASLRAAVASTPAVRAGNAVQVAPTVPPPPRTVEQMIRDVWPDDSEARALQIAWRESNYRPDVTSRTGCCLGVFQLHKVHLSWMRDYGITSAAQLYDAETNIRMALVLFQAQGWKPWAL